MQTAPDKWRLLRAHGLSVGLPSDEDMGNSEVGHNALGAGRIFEQGCVSHTWGLSTVYLYLITLSAPNWLDQQSEHQLL